MLIAVILLCCAYCSLEGYARAIVQHIDTSKLYFTRLSRVDAYILCLRHIVHFAAIALFLRDTPACCCVYMMSIMHVLSL
jgi:hypothetical protein